MNPADALRKEERKKELKKNKKTRVIVQEVKVLLDNPQKIEDEIQKLQLESDSNKLDKRLKDRIKELKMMKSVALKQQQIKIATGGGKAPAASGATAASTTADDDEEHQQQQQQQQRNPEDSVYYHPQFNPSGNTAKVILDINLLLLLFFLFQ